MPSGSRTCQTDAAISGGQSGGALVDGDGWFLGLSGLGLDQNFALALSATDVRTAIDRITETGGDERRIVPEIAAAGSDPVAVELTLDNPSFTVIIPAGDEERTVRLDLGTDADVFVDVQTVLWEPIGSNEVSLDNWESFEFEGQPGGVIPGAPGDVVDPMMTELPDELDEPDPGVYEFDVPADQDVIATVALAADDAELTVDADVPFVLHRDTAEGEAITVGEPLRHVVDGFTWDVVHPLELEAGQEVDIVVRGGHSDAYFSIVEPGSTEGLWSDVMGEDGGGGLFDLDPQETFTASETGTHRLVVGTYDGVVGSYQIEVTPTGD